MEIPVLDVSQLRIVDYYTSTNTVFVGKFLDIDRGSFIVCELSLGPARNNLMFYILPLRIVPTGRTPNLLEYFNNLKKAGLKIVGIASNGESELSTMTYNEFMKSSAYITIKY